MGAAPYGEGFHFLLEVDPTNKTDEEVAEEVMREFEALIPSLRSLVTTFIGKVLSERGSAH